MTCAGRSLPSRSPPEMAARRPAPDPNATPAPAPRVGAGTSAFVWDAFDRAPTFIAVLRGPDHTFEYYNRAYHRLIGLRDVLGLSVRAALPEVEGQGFFELLDRALASGEAVGGDGVGVTLQRAPDAPPEERRLDFVYQPLLGADGCPDGVLVLGVDMTEREANARALRDSEARYRTLFTSMDEGYCVIEMIYDDDGRSIDYRFLETNPAFEGQTGLVDAVGRTMRELIPNHEDSWFEIYGRVADTGDPIRFVNRSGVLDRWFSLFAFRIGAPEERRVAVLFTDVSAQKRAERSLQALNETLEARVETRTREVRELASRLTLAEQTERQRIAQVLHDDLQQQLYGLSMLLALAQGRLAGTDAAGHLDRATTVVQDAIRATRLLVSELSPAALASPALADTLDWLAIDAGTKYGLEVDAEVEAGVQVSDEAVRSVLYQTVREALFNVAKHAGVRRAHVRGRADGGEVVVEVVDSGAGFDADAACGHPRAGLGLRSSRERVFAAGGRLDVTSAPGAGTRVTVRLPL